MIIDLIKLEKSPFAFSFTLAPDEIDLGAETARIRGATAVEGNLTKQIAQIDAAGKISAETELECTRCLMPIEKTLEIDFQAVFISPEHYTESKETELNADDLDVSVIENEEINLNELVREQILLNLPEQIFCRENCRGLCPKCGANRNEKDCNCIEKEVDPRWAALKNLK